MSYYFPHSLPSKERLLMFKMDLVILWGPGRGGNADSNQVDPFLKSLLRFLNIPSSDPASCRKTGHKCLRRGTREESKACYPCCDWHCLAVSTDSALDALWCLKNCPQGQQKIFLVQQNLPVGKGYSGVTSLSLFLIGVREQRALLKGGISMGAKIFSFATVLLLETGHVLTYNGAFLVLLSAQDWLIEASLLWDPVSSLTSSWMLMNYKWNPSTLRYGAAKQFMWGCKTSLNFQTSIWSMKVVSGKKSCVKL